MNASEFCRRKVDRQGRYGVWVRGKARPNQPGRLEGGRVVEYVRGSLSVCQLVSRVRQSRCMQGKARRMRAAYTHTCSGGVESAFLWTKQ